MKTCTKCDEIKDFREFSSNKSKKDGFSSQCKTCHNIVNKQYYAKNKVRLKPMYQKLRDATKEYKREYNAKWNKNNAQKRRDASKTWSKKNKDKISRRINAYFKKRSKADLDFKLRNILRSRLNKAVRKTTKSCSAVRDLGCTIEQLRFHLESLFQPGMTWENYGFRGWHIDHIKPLSSFDLANKEEAINACHYTNLQPLWAEDNLKKSNKVA